MLARDVFCGMGNDPTGPCSQTSGPLLLKTYEAIRTVPVTMLKFLSIENFALVDHLEVEFESGLNLITGETGSGKSILVDAVGLLVGRRASSEMIRQECSLARVEGLFRLESEHPAIDLLRNSGIDVEEDVIVRREVSTTGSNKVFINGRLATLGFLAEIGQTLVDIHGQHDQQQLLQPVHHLEFLDAFGRNETLRHQVEQAFAELEQVRKAITALRENEQERLQRLDMLRFQISDITKLRLIPGLESQLEEEKRLLSSAARRLSTSQSAYQLLYEQDGAVLEVLGKLGQELGEAGLDDPRLSEVGREIEDLRFRTEEAALELRDYQDGIEFNPARLEQVDERLAEVHQACRKYGRTSEDLLPFVEQLEADARELELGESRLEELEAKLDSAASAFTEAACRLAEKRRIDAEALKSEVEAELSHLAMEETVFEVRLRPLSEPGGKGSESVDFLISANVGEEPRPLARTASGGELSRIILALKSILTLETHTKTLVFDEVDSGVGGRVAGRIGARLAGLAVRHQVFCVTHLPQIAARATRHFHVSKETSDGRTIIRIRPLASEERVGELSRMMSGDSSSEAAVRHAEAMLQEARLQTPAPVGE